MQIAVRSVNGDRPKAVDGNLAIDGELVNGLAVVLFGHDR
jgi:hypothetical protein